GGLTRVRHERQTTVVGNLDCFAERRQRKPWLVAPDSDPDDATIPIAHRHLGALDRELDRAAVAIDVGSELHAYAEPLERLDRALGVAGVDLVPVQTEQHPFGWREDALDIDRAEPGRLRGIVHHHLPEVLGRP